MGQIFDKTDFSAERDKKLTMESFYPAQWV